MVISVGRFSVREVLSSAVFIVIVGGLFVLNIVAPAPEVLLSERRVPAKLPDFGVSSVLSGGFMGRFDDYAADSFVCRDVFRRINAFVMLDVYMLSDKSGLYRSDRVGIGEFRGTKEVSYRQAAERVRRASEGFAGLGMNFYYSIVPDKSVFAERYMPGFDIGVAEAVLSEQLGGFEYIRLFDHLDADAFYRTDLHWDQARIGGLAGHVLGAMGAEAGLDGFAVGSAGEFNGVYSGQLALPVEGDIMSFLEVPGLEVSYLNEKTMEFESGPVYDSGAFLNIDPYDFFLRGPQPLVAIRNDAAPDRELYVFRDSFGSSLAPLLASAYSKVVLIDLRYIHMMMLDRFVEFVPGSDVLFLYSSQIYNNPGVLQT